MKDPTIIHEEHGPHPGWRHVFFDFEGQLWKLSYYPARGEDNEQCSLSTAMEYKGGKYGHAPGQSDYFDGHLTVKAAAKIITIRDRERMRAFAEGEHAARRKILNALGL